MLPNTECLSHRHVEHKLTSFCCPRPFTALLSLLSGIIQRLPELNPNSTVNQVVISQRLKADAYLSKLKSKENTRHNSKAENALYLLLEEHAWRTQVNIFLLPLPVHCFVVVVVRNPS